MNMRNNDNKDIYREQCSSFFITTEEDKDYELPTDRKSTLTAI